MRRTSSVALRGDQVPAKHLKLKHALANSIEELPAGNVVLNHLHMAPEVTSRLNTGQLECWCSVSISQLL